MTFFNVSASSLASKWRGDSEKLVRVSKSKKEFYTDNAIVYIRFCSKWRDTTPQAQYFLMKLMRLAPNE